eukprot:m.76371 g.76371  ORF g.76371 m.76371 type:complete len:70 (+) comp7867_c0_seq1:361-570(+)
MTIGIPIMLVGCVIIIVFCLYESPHPIKPGPYDVHPDPTPPRKDIPANGALWHLTFVGNEAQVTQETRT